MKSRCWGNWVYRRSLALAGEYVCRDRWDGTGAPSAICVRRRSGGTFGVGSWEGKVLVGTGIR